MQETGKRRNAGKRTPGRCRPPSNGVFDDYSPSRASSFGARGCMRARTQIALLILGTGLVACPDPISRSHIDANVPDATNFDRFLQRDVDAWFSAKFAPAPPVKCSTELL